MLGEQLENMTGLETRAVVMGHLQRGGTPSAYDRVLATQLGTKATEMINDKKFGYMVGINRNQLVEVSLEEVAKGPRLISADNLLVRSAQSVGTCFGV